ncbi:MAG: L,D-transpeptidase [Bdellovibrionales bacterium]|nr:L,D-transpeptidase [Bdellovibrionales bacterium]MBT3527243.1 L,D-transpeptidase [Bdellovibrionales bacterium]MBT7767692.1 L,D-transpeptidase [Bdellovibrionales bacterium]
MFLVRWYKYREKSITRWSLLLVVALSITGNLKAEVTTVEEFDQQLLERGVAWKGRIVPSFYVGFAPRVENHQNILFQVARGNQARLTAILDEQAVLTYLYQLKKRYDVYHRLMGSKFRPVHQNQLQLFYNIIESDRYNILGTIEQFEAGQLTRQQLYSRSLQIMKELNRWRIFQQDFDLNKIFVSWEQRVEHFISISGLSHGATIEDTLTALEQNPQDSMVLVNEIMRGRIITTALSRAQQESLAELLWRKVNGELGRDSYLALVQQLFKQLADGLYNFRAVVDGKLVNALRCDQTEQCRLSYPEFNGIYPVGSLRGTTTDRLGNKINRFATYGYRHFVGSTRSGIDRIRGKKYYGWIPKMDYEKIGNGIHNPAVITKLRERKHRWLHQKLGIPTEFDTLWAVSRGRVSHGCIRMAAGHIWEVRHIFPAESEATTKLRWLGSDSRDYDVFDIDGDGKDEVMGVDYLIGYSFKDRVGTGLIGASFDRQLFYRSLYGENGQVYLDQSSGRYMVNRPFISYFLPPKGEEKVRPFSRQVAEDLPLYQQPYEKDKIQFFLTRRGGRPSASWIRGLGRIVGCGPFQEEFPTCYEARFDRNF